MEFCMEKRIANLQVKLLLYGALHEIDKVKISARMSLRMFCMEKIYKN
jgi:hypothetical protein